MKYFLLLGFFLSQIQGSQAQQPSSEFKHTDLTVQSLIEFAQRDLSVVNQQLTDLAAKGDAFSSVDTCTFTKLEFEQNYINWFLQHELDFKQMEADYFRIYKAAEYEILDKIQFLKKISIPAVPTEGQTERVALNLDEAIVYLNSFNERYRKQSEKTLPDFMRMVEKPQMNPPLFLGHSQVLASLQRMTLRINASLKESSENFRLNFELTQAGATLVLEKLGQKTKAFYSVSLLDHFDLTPERNFWRFIAEQNRQVATLPVEAVARIWKLQNQPKKTSCELESKLPRFIRFEVDRFPYVSLERLRKVLARGERIIPTEVMIDPNMPQMVQVYRYSGVRQHRKFVGDFDEISISFFSKLRNSQVNKHDFTFEKASFKLSSNKTDVFSRALYQCIPKGKAAYEDNFLTTSTSCESTGYLDRSAGSPIIGYISPLQNKISSLPLYRCCHRTDSFNWAPYLACLATTELKECSEKFYPLDGTLKDGIIGYVAP